MLLYDLAESAWQSHGFASYMWSNLTDQFFQNTVKPQHSRTDRLARTERRIQTFMLSFQTMACVLIGRRIKVCGMC